MVKVIELTEKDDTSLQVTLTISADGTKRIRAMMERFHKINGLDDEIAELMHFAIIKTTSR